MKKILYANNARSFAVKLVIFIATIALVDLIIGRWLHSAYFRQQQGENALTTYAIKKVKKQVLVFGSSRAVNIVDPAVIENETGLTSFNAGRIGQPVFYHYAVLKAALKRYTPEVIILTVDAWDLEKDEKDYDRISSLLPYYSNCSEVKDAVHLRGPFEKLKLVSSIYPYNSLLLPIIKSSLKTQKSGWEFPNGYMGSKKVHPGPAEKIDFSIKNRELDTLKINTYISFINECKSKGVKLYIVCPPYFVKPVGENLSLVTAKSIANRLDVPYLDFAHNNRFTESNRLFADFRHLNYWGSQELSRMIAEQINVGDTGNLSLSAR